MAKTLEKDAKKDRTDAPVVSRELPGAASAKGNPTAPAVKAAPAVAPVAAIARRRLRRLSRTLFQ